MSLRLTRTLALRICEHVRVLPLTRLSYPWVLVALPAVDDATCPPPSLPAISREIVKVCSNNPVTTAYMSRSSSCTYCARGPRTDERLSFTYHGTSRVAFNQTSVRYGVRNLTKTFGKHFSKDRKYARQASDIVGSTFKAIIQSLTQSTMSSFAYLVSTTTTSVGEGGCDENERGWNAG